MDDESMRVSDADREDTVAALREHLLAGRLTLEEFSERVEAALRARFGRDLAQVRQDLPEIYAGEAGSRRTARFSGALLGHVVRRGRRGCPGGRSLPVFSETWTLICVKPRSISDGQR